MHLPGANSPPAMPPNTKEMQPIPNTARDQGFLQNQLSSLGSLYPVSIIVCYACSPQQMWGDRRSEHF